MDKSIEWHLEHKRLGFYDPIAELYEELQAKAQLSEEDATFNAENVEPNATQDVQGVGCVGDYISRQAAIEEFSCCELTPDGGIDANYAVEFLENLPAADVVEVVRCRDCARYDTHDKRCRYWNHGIKVDDYCSKAERRTE